MASRTNQGWGPATPQPRAQNQGIFKYAGTALGFIIGVFVLTLFFGSWYTVDQTERGVLLRNGAYVETVQPGLHFKWPWIESVTKVSLQTHTMQYKAMESYSADQQPAHLTVSVTFHVSPDRIKDFYERFAGDAARAVERQINPNVLKESKIVFGHYTAANAITDRGKLNNEIDAAIKQGLSYDPIFSVDAVQVEDITYSAEYIHSVEQRMQAEVEVQKLQQNLKKTEVEANIRRTEAAGYADATRAKAQAEADATVYKAKADSQGIELRGNAEAKAITARAQALGQNANLVLLTQAERWDGKLPSTMLPESSVPMLNLRAQQ